MSQAPVDSEAGGAESQRVVRAPHLPDGDYAIENFREVEDDVAAASRLSPATPRTERAFLRGSDHRGAPPLSARGRLGAGVPARGGAQLLPPALRQCAVYGRVGG